MLAPSNNHKQDTFWLALFEHIVLENVTPFRQVASKTVIDDKNQALAQAMLHAKMLGNFETSKAQVALILREPIAKEATGADIYFRAKLFFLLLEQWERDTSVWMIRTEHIPMIPPYRDEKVGVLSQFNELEATVLHMAQQRKQVMELVCEWHMNTAVTCIVHADTLNEDKVATSKKVYLNKLQLACKNWNKQGDGTIAGQLANINYLWALLWQHDDLNLFMETKEYALACAKSQYSRIMAKWNMALRFLHVGLLWKNKHEYLYVRLQASKHNAMHLLDELKSEFEHTNPRAHAIVLLQQSFVWMRSGELYDAMRALNESIAALNAHGDLFHYFSASVLLLICKVLCTEDVNFLCIIEKECNDTYQILVNEVKFPGLMNLLGHLYLSFGVHAIVSITSLKNQFQSALMLFQLALPYFVHSSSIELYFHTLHSIDNLLQSINEKERTELFKVRDEDSRKIRHLLSQQNWSATIGPPLNGLRFPTMAYFIYEQFRMRISSVLLDQMQHWVVKNQSKRHDILESAAYLYAFRNKLLDASHCYKVFMKHVQPEHADYLHHLHIMTRFSVMIEDFNSATYYWKHLDHEALMRQSNDISDLLYLKGCIYEAKGKYIRAGINISRAMLNCMDKVPRVWMHTLILCLLKLKLPQYALICMDDMMHSWMRASWTESTLLNYSWSTVDTNFPKPLLEELLSVLESGKLYSNICSYQMVAKTSAYQNYDLYTSMDVVMLCKFYISNLNLQVGAKHAILIYHPMDTILSMISITGEDGIQHVELIANINTQEEQAQLDMFLLQYTSKSKTWKKFARNIAFKYLSPFQNILANYSRIIICATGFASLVPFHSLLVPSPIEKKESLLGETHCVSYIPSLSFWLEAHSLKDEDRFVKRPTWKQNQSYKMNCNVSEKGIFIVEADKSLHEEAFTIKRILDPIPNFEVVKEDGKFANKTNVLSKMKTPDIIHFCATASFVTDPIHDCLSKQQSYSMVLPTAAPHWLAQPKIVLADSFLSMMEWCTKHALTIQGKTIVISSSQRSQSHYNVNWAHFLLSKGAKAVLFNVLPWTEKMEESMRLFYTEWIDNQKGKDPSLAVRKHLGANFFYFGMT